MPFLRCLPREASYAEIERLSSGIQGPFRALTQRLLRGPSPFSVAERELIGSFISALNGCGWCYGIHAEVARAFGIEESVLTALVEDLDRAPVDARLKPILHYVRKLNATPSRMVEADAASVFAAGWNDEALLHAVAICGLFNYANRFFDGIGMASSPDRYAFIAGTIVRSRYWPLPLRARLKSALQSVKAALLRGARRGPATAIN